MTTPLPVSGTPAPRTGQPDASATVLAFLTHTSRQSCVPALRGVLGLGRGAGLGAMGPLLACAWLMDSRDRVAHVATS